MKRYLILLLILTACATETNYDEKYKQLCLENNHGWMKMSELKDGAPTGNTCYGCMPDEKNHICTQQEYEVFIQ